MSLLRDRVPIGDAALLDTEALIKEARRRQRRRWAIGLVAVVLIAVGSSVAATRGTTPRRLVPANGRGVGKSTTAGATPISPRQPAALAIGPNGNLYIADGGRNQILERLTNGRFKVVAGNGRRGFTGDGGPAVDAEIDSPGSLAITASGDLYLSQAGRLTGVGGMLNSVIREVAPDGKITTVAGLYPNCNAVRSNPDAVPAQEAEFYGAELSIGPAGGLDVDATVCPNVLRLGRFLQLTAAGELTGTSLDAVPAASVDCGGGARGTDMVVFSCESGGGGTKYGHGPELLVVRSNGPTVAFPDVGSQPGLMATSNGAVVVAHNGSIDRIDASGRLQVIATDGRFLGRLPKALGLWPDAGLAVNRHGDIYISTDTYGHQGCVPAIFEISPNGHIQELWHSAPISLCY